MPSSTLTIDKAGRLVLPKAIRERYRLRPGAHLEVVANDDHIELRPVGMGPSLAKVDGWWVYQGTPEGDADLAGAVARHREERVEDLSR
jgi:AbrB family looped-hinge helix DNA binding protein